MNNGQAMARETSAGMTAVLLVLLLLTSGCASPRSHSVHRASTLSYVPYRSATKPMQPPPYQADAFSFGYHATCWRPWPCCSEYWIEDFEFEAAGEQVPTPVAEPIRGATYHLNSASISDRW